MVKEMDNTMNTTTENTMSDTNTNTTESNVTKFKNGADHAIALMREMSDKPMAEVVERMTREVFIRGQLMTLAKARHYYRSAAKDGRAPGNVPLPAKAEKTPKPAKAPKAEKPAAAPADRLEMLKAAAKRAGIHLDTVPVDEPAVETEVVEPAETVDRDPLNLAAPESLSVEDLKTIL